MYLPAANKLGVKLTTLPTVKYIATPPTEEKPYVDFPTMDVGVVPGLERIGGEIAIWQAAWDRAGMIPSPFGVYFALYAGLVDALKSQLPNFTFERAEAPDTSLLSIGEARRLMTYLDSYFRTGGRISAAFESPPLTEAYGASGAVWTSMLPPKNTEHLFPYFKAGIVALENYLNTQTKLATLTQEQIAAGEAAAERFLEQVQPAAEVTVTENGQAVITPTASPMEAGVRPALGTVAPILIGVGVLVLLAMQRS